MEIENLSRDLQTARSSDPETIREQMLDAFVEHFRAKLGMFFKVKYVDGVPHYTEMQVSGPDAELGSLYRQWCDEPMLDSPWGPEGPDADEVNRFICSRETHDLEEYEVHNDMNDDYDVHDQIRCLAYDGGRFLGWFGFMRRGKQDLLDESHARRAHRAIDETRTRLAAAQELEDREFDDRSTLYILCRSDGSIAEIAPLAARWVDEDRREYLRDWVRTFDATGETPSMVFEFGCELRLLRLDGDDGVRYLVDIDRRALPKLDPSQRLTERQLEVAEYAAAGARNSEIARTLDVSRSTVKYHLQRIYRRLDVDGRADLARLL